MRSIHSILLLAVLVVGTVCNAGPTKRVEFRLKRVTSEAEIEQAFLDRAVPGSAKYMKHMTASEVASLVRGAPGAAEAVASFVASTSGATLQRVFRGGDAVTASIASGTAAAAALGLHEKDGVTARVPAALESHVERIVVLPDVAMQPHHMRPRIEANINSPTTLNPWEAGMVQDPYTLYARYNVPNATLPVDVVQGVSEFSGTGFSQRAMDVFNEHYGLYKTQVVLKGPSIFNSAFAQGAGEGQLDVEYIAAMAPNVTTYWIAGNSTPSGIPWWSEWCDTVLSLDPLPEVISISWFVFESSLQYNQTTATFFSEQGSSTRPGSTTMPPAVVIAEDGFRKLALAGITVTVASGDNGPNSWNGDCNNAFGPEYPTTSQYTVSVGATYANTTGGSEASVSWSGGGFSWFVPQPSWQKQVVGAYLAANSTGMPPSTMYNAAGRAYPDVAALGTNYVVAGDDDFFNSTQTSYTSLDYSLIGGTSAAAPTFAGIITRVVSERKAKGKGPLGCITPTLYQLKKVGQDVTIGRTGNGCGTEFSTDSTASFTSAHGYGFPTAEGWDAATGFGTPNYEYLLTQLG